MREFLAFIGAALGSTHAAKSQLTADRLKALDAFLASDERHVFPVVAKPKATVVIPVYNHAYHTLQCLLSLEKAAFPGLEILVWDDGSSDATNNLVARFKNVRLLKSATNQGFLRSVNAAVEAAKGEFIVLMNNDALLVSGSIAAAIEKFEREPNCGAMGARIELASGGLQEAGGMIFANGTTNGYLRHRPVDDPRVLLQRDVDYCSGVFLIFRRMTFLDMGGFDEIYLPAYYEETDFALRLWQAGLRNIYNPDILIEHFEFGSRPNRRTRELIYRNRSVFLARWGSHLAKDGYLKRYWILNEERAAWRLMK